MKEKARVRVLCFFAAPVLLVVAAGCAGGESVASQKNSLTPSLVPVSFSPNPAGLKAYKYVPAKLPSGPVPLVVPLHGCTQSVAQFDQAAEWHRAADELGFIVLFPEQSSSNNPMSCFNWAGVYGNLTGITRGQGEPASIASMVKQVQADHSIDSSRIYVAGFSAGGCMATVMLATYPDVFAGGTIMEGVPYHCADNVAPALSCMQNGKINNGGTVVDGTPEQWADLVRKYAGFSSYWSNPPRVPSLMVWQGLADGMVNPENQKSLLKQWTALHGLALAPSTTSKLKGYNLEEWQKNGKPVIQSMTIPSLQHAVAIDPGTAADQGGVAGSYVQDVNIFGPYYAAKFLVGSTSSGPPPPPPPPPGSLAVKITAPADGASVSGVVKISVDATSASGVSKVELYVDGALVGTAASAPHVFNWDSSSYPATVAHGLNGTSVKAAHLSAVAYDGAGNKAKAEITVIIKPGSSAGGDTTPPTLTVTKPALKIVSAGTLLKINPVQIAGTANDNVGVARVELAVSQYPYLSCYGTSTPLKTYIASGTSAWSYSLDVSTFVNYKCYRVEVRAFDAANLASAPAQLFVNVMNSATP